jgi:nicotinamide-nucleotide amidase
MAQAAGVIGGTKREAMTPDLLADAEALLSRCRNRGLKLATAESCTGGMIAATLTAISGSADVFERGYITYSNEAKTEMLGISAGLIETAGAVSEEVARAMAEAAVARSRADFAVSVTGIAGPTGGSTDKPVGLVWLGLAGREGPVRTERHVFPGDRSHIRIATVARAFAMLREAAD